MPILELKSMATKSSELAVEHSIWSLPSCLATAGNDLFSSLWAAIEGCLKATASAIRIDDVKGGHGAQAEMHQTVCTPLLVPTTQCEESIGSVPCEALAAARQVETHSGVALWLQSK